MFMVLSLGTAGLGEPSCSGDAVVVVVVATETSPSTRVREGGEVEDGGKERTQGR